MYPEVFPTTINYSINYDICMGRRNEANRLAHKKKADDKKKRAQDAHSLRKEKLKRIVQGFNEQNNTEKKD